MAGNSDFNDLHVTAGLDEVRRQLLEAVEKFSADTSITDIDSLIRRYALTKPKAEVWDSEQKQFMTRSVFKLLVGSAAYQQWLDHPNLERVDHDQMAREKAAAQLKGDGPLAKALRRYVYLYPSDTVWDCDLRDIVLMKDLKYKLAGYFSTWNEHPFRREINRENLIFDPACKKAGKGHINQFRGFPLEPGDSKGCPAILQMTLDLCNRDIDVWNWLMKWLAYPLQNPGAKMATAIMMHSEIQGSGKSLLFDNVMRPIYGEYGATLGQHQMESQYTDWRSQKCYGVFEEIFSRDQKYSHTGTVKQFITGQTQRIEKKFVSGWEEANYMNAVFLSNEIQPFPIEPSDRRMLVIWPGTKLDPELEKKVTAEIKDTGPADFYAYLLNMDLGDFHPHSKPVETEAKRRIIDFGRSGWDSFYMEWKEGELEIPYATCLSRDLFDYYRNWSTQRNEHAVSFTKFSAMIGARERKKKKIRYRDGVSAASGPNKQGTFFIVGQVPEKEQVEYFTDAVETFRKAIRPNEDMGDFAA